MLRYFRDLALAGGLPDRRSTLGTAAKMYTDRYCHDREFDTVEAYPDPAKQAGVEPATLAIAWVLANPAITSPIVGAGKPEQFAASVAAVELRLDPALKAKLDELTHEFRMGDAVR